MADPIEESRPEETEEDGGGPVKTFLEHLEDLRWMLIKSGAALLVGMIVCLYATHQVVTILKRPLQHAALIQVGHTQKVLVRLGTNTLATLEPSTNRIGPLDLGTNRLVIIQIEPFESGTNILVSLRVDLNPPPEELLASGTDLVYLDPSAPFLSSLHLAFFAGILLAAPFIIYFVAQFVLPALKIREKKYVFRAFAVGVGLFLVGVCFCYFFVLARALKFMLGMGLGFELPVVLLALVKMGILDYQKLKAMRRYMVVINLILGALLTTPEIFTQVVMAIVLQMLYEVSVGIAWYWERKEKKRAAEAGLSEDEAGSSPENGGS